MMGRKKSISLTDDVRQDASADPRKGAASWIGAEVEDKKTHITEIRDWCKYADAPMRKAAKWALAEIERLTQENADLKSKLERESTEELTRKIAELALLCVDSQCDVIRLKKRVNKLLHARLNNSVVLVEDDVRWEVIE